MEMAGEADLTTEAQFQTVLRLLAQIAERWHAKPRDGATYYGPAMAGIFLGRALVVIYQHQPEPADRETFNSIVTRISDLAGSEGLSVVDSGDRPTGGGPVAAAVKNMLDCAAAAGVIGDWAKDQGQRHDALAMYMIDHDWLDLAEDTAGTLVMWPSRGRFRRDVEAQIKKLGGRAPQR
jgi:hypothetical protein